MDTSGALTLRIPITQEHLEKETPGSKQQDMLHYQQ